MPPRPVTPPPPVAPAELPHQKLTIKQVTDVIERQLTKDYTARLNITALPPEIQAGIVSAAAVAAARATRANLENEALKIAKQFFQPASVPQLIAGKLQQAKAGVQIVSGSADLATILDENAKMLAAKRAALEKNGFKPDEAFQLILAEIQGKAARRGTV